MKKIYLSLFLCLFSITLAQAMEGERFQRGDISKQAQKKPRISHEGLQEESSAQESTTVEQPALVEDADNEIELLTSLLQMQELAQEEQPALVEDINNEIELLTSLFQTQELAQEEQPALVEDIDNEIELLTSLLQTQELAQEKTAFTGSTGHPQVTHTIKLDNFSPELQTDLQKFLLGQLSRRSDEISGFIEKIFSVLPIGFGDYDFQNYIPFPDMSKFQTIGPKQAFFIGSLMDTARRVRIFLRDLDYKAPEEKDEFIQENRGLYCESLNPHVVEDMNRLSSVLGGNYVSDYFRNYYSKVLKAVEEFRKNSEGGFKFPHLPHFDYSKVEESK